MNENELLINRFYQAFAVRDWKTMQACYHESATFCDPVFKNLSRGEVKAMWHMLAEAAQGLIVTFKNVKATQLNGTCQWEARYNFSRTGRPVHNKITAEFSFKDGKIIAHRDTFDLWKWSSMALGVTGMLLGWSPMVQGKVRQTALKSLEKFIQGHPEYQV